MSTITGFIWYMVEQIERHRNTTIHQVIVSGRHLDFTLSRHQDITEFASESGQFTLTPSTDDVYPQQLKITYSDNDVRDELNVYTAENIDGDIAPTAILNIQPYDEPLYQLLNQFEDIIQENPTVFQQHTERLKKQFMICLNGMYDRYVPKTHTIRFVGYFLVEGDNIPLGRLSSGEVVTIASSSVTLHLDEDYPAVRVNGEYFIHDQNSVERNDNQND